MDFYKALLNMQSGKVFTNGVVELSVQKVEELEEPSLVIKTEDGTWSATVPSLSFFESEWTLVKQ